MTYTFIAKCFARFLIENTEKVSLTTISQQIQLKPTGLNGLYGRSYDSPLSQFRPSSPFSTLISGSVSVHDIAFP